MLKEIIEETFKKSSNRKDPVYNMLDLMNAIDPTGKYLFIESEDWVRTFMFTKFGNKVEGYRLVGEPGRGWRLKSVK